MKVSEYIKSDCFRYNEKADLLTVIKFYFLNSTFRWQVAFRLCHGTGLTRIIGRVLWVLNRSRQRIQASPYTDIGYGLYIGHGGPVLIAPTAVIGNNCNLSQFTTIGTNNDTGAIIGDNVYIGPSVCIIEDVHIGDNVTIGAGSVVTKDIPANATAAGNYAKVLNFNDPGRFVCSRWEVK